MFAIILSSLLSLFCSLAEAQTSSTHTKTQIEAPNISTKTIAVQISTHAVTLSTAPAISTPTVKAPVFNGSVQVIYPPEGLVMASAPGEWIMGSIKPAKGTLSINGKSVTPHQTGGFLAYLPVAPGSFTFHCELQLPTGSTSHDRTIYVTPSPQPLPAGVARIDVESIQPAEDIELRPWDWLIVQMKGTPDMNAQFQIAGRKKMPMTATNPSLGIYQGTYQILPGDDMEDALIHFYLKGRSWSQATAKANGRLTVRTNAPPIAMVKSNGSTNVRSAPGEGFMLFPTFGTRFVTAGRQGSEIKLQISPTLNGWINSSNVQMLPAGTPPPHASLGTIKTTAGSNDTTVSLGLTEIVPFSIDVAPDLSRLDATLFYTTTHTNWVIYDSEDPFVRQVRWKQKDAQTTIVSIDLTANRRLWGHYAGWENGQLKINIRQPPSLPSRGSVFKNLNVVLDPGHMPSAPGAIGPTGLLEKDANLAIAKALEPLLTREGANVIMTRIGDEEVGLTDRPRIAHEQKGDIFVSIHNNNIPDAVNPFEYPHGFSIFFYQPMSLKLAKTMHRAYQKQISLPDEGLRFGDLLVARITDMPAILIESAYMTYPDQEAMLNTPSFHKRLAATMRDGMRDFLESERALQNSMKRAQKR